MTGDPLRDALAALAAVLAPAGIPLIIGGGYGLVLREESLLRQQRENRYGVLARVRSTEDLDCVLGLDIITDGAKTRRIRHALAELGYASVESYWAFARTIDWHGTPQTIRVELMAPDVTGPRAALVHRGSALRIRPASYDQLHARRNPAAITVEQRLTPVNIGGSAEVITVLIPHAASFLLMKVFAFRDRWISEENGDRERAPYHAFDMFMLLATMDRGEWEEAVGILRSEAAAAVVAEAGAIVRQYFKSANSEGVVEMAAYARARMNVPVTEQNRHAFATDMCELFGVRNGPR